MIYCDSEQIHVGQFRYVKILTESAPRLLGIKHIDRTSDRSRGKNQILWDFQRQICRKNGRFGIFGRSKNSGGQEYRLN